MHALHGRSPTPCRTLSWELPVKPMLGYGGHGEPAGPRPRDDHPRTGRCGCPVLSHIDKPRQSTGYNARRAAMLTWVLRQSPPSSMTCGSQTCDPRTGRVTASACGARPNEHIAGSISPPGTTTRITARPNLLLLSVWGPLGPGADRVACRWWILCLVVTWPAGMPMRVRRGETHGPALT